MAKNMEAPFVFGVRVEGDAFTDRREETERLKANHSIALVISSISTRLAKRTGWSISAKDLRRQESIFQRTWHVRYAWLLIDIPLMFNSWHGSFGCVRQMLLRLHPKMYSMASTDYWMLASLCLSNRRKTFLPIR